MKTTGKAETSVKSEMTMKILCRLWGHKYKNNACIRCGYSLDFKRMIQYLALSGPLVSSRITERIRKNLLNHPDQEAVAWEIAGAIGRCNSGRVWDGVPIHPKSKAMLEDLGRAMLDKAGLGGLKVTFSNDKDPAA